MDRNQATGLFLISALLLVYLFFFSPKDKVEKDKTQATTSTAAKPATAAAVALPAVPRLDSAAGPVRSIRRERTGGMYSVSAQPSGANRVSRIRRPSCARL